MLHRRRISYALALPMVMGVGLALRSGAAAAVFPELVVKYGGDALWALLVFLGLRLVSARAPIWVAAAGALAFAYGIEFSQLYHAGWIDAWRARRLGAVILGSTFNWPDFPAYTLGVALGAGTARWAEARGEAAGKPASSPPD